MDLQGVIPRIVQDIFEHIYAMDTDLEFHIKVLHSAARLACGVSTTLCMCGVRVCGHLGRVCCCIWRQLLIEYPCLSVSLSVCLSVCLSVPLSCQVSYFEVYMEKIRDLLDGMREVVCFSNCCQ